MTGKIELVGIGALTVKQAEALVKMVLSAGSTVDWQMRGMTVREELAAKQAAAKLERSLRFAQA